MPTPAEKLASKKHRERKPRNSPKIVRNSPVVCHCRELRNSMNLSMRDVAEEIGITIAGYHAIEHGGNVTMEYAFKIAAFYGKRIDELWTSKKGGAK